jgi:hypothetical protein
MLNAYLFAEAGNWITEQQWGDLHYNSINEPHHIYPLPITKHYNNHAKIALSCIGKLDWSESFESLTYWLYKIARYYNTHLGGDYSRFTFVHFPLMYIVLHDINISDDNYYFDYYMSYIERLLDMASVDGPSVGLYDINNDGTIGDYDYSSEFWGTAGKRLVKPVGMDLPDNYQSKHWEYNGIDYMLLYNLYLLGLYSQDSNSLNITENFPTRYNGWEGNGLTGGVDEDDITIGKQTDETALHISSLSDIEANNTIKSNAKVVYTSSGNVVLAPGFEVETGGEFAVEINEYNYQKN